MVNERVPRTFFSFSLSFFFSSVYKLRHIVFFTTRYPVENGEIFGFENRTGNFFQLRDITDASYFFPVIRHYYIHLPTIRFDSIRFDLEFVKISARPSNVYNSYKGKGPSRRQITLIIV